MIECIFTIDYEIYGNGEGSLKELVYDPAEKLLAVFLKWDARFVTFVEVAEFEMIEKNHADSASNDVRRQIGDLHKQGFEIGLHLHPQWYNARYENGRWFLDYSEYNLCKLSRERVYQIVSQSIEYLRGVLAEPDFTPRSFRAGNWLLQPTATVASILAEMGIKIDSSVFKGGFQRGHGLDYRPARKNGYYWCFQNDVNVHDRHGSLIEIPTYTMMVPIWKMFTSKRIAMQRKSVAKVTANQPKTGRYLDYLRLTYPKKFDFCRMTLEELVSMVDNVIDIDRKSPETYRPLVAIGHTKDLTSINVIDQFLAYLNKRNIPVKTFNDIHSKCNVCA